MHLVNVAPEETFQALADPTRIRIVRLMAIAGEEVCLCELADSLLEPHYKLSRHVKVLRQAGFLTAEKDGRWVYHRLVRGVPALDLLWKAITVLEDRNEVFALDLKRFKQRMALRENGRCRVGILTRGSAAQGL